MHTNNYSLIPAADLVRAVEILTKAHIVETFSTKWFIIEWIIIEVDLYQILASP